MTTVALSDAFATRLADPSPDTLERVRAAFLSHLDATTRASIDACVRCGLCAETCHVFLADDDPRSSPVSKVGLVSRVAHGERATSAAAAWLRGARRLDAAVLQEWVDSLFGRCTMCGRCTFNCVAGVNVPALVRAARRALVAGGLVPPDLQAAVTLSVERGNSMGIARDEWVDTVKWLEDELQAEVGDPAARLPLDVHGADFLYTVNPREAKFFPLSLVAAGAIFYAAGVNWTLSSETYDLTNYGLFSGDDEAAATISDRVVREARALGVRTIVIGECGHGFASNRWWSPEWRHERQDVEVRSVLEVVHEFLRDGRIAVDPSRVTRRLTLHDPCNLVRQGGVSEPQRAILDRSARAWVEMTPSREQNYCCGGGGGQLAMAAFAKRRLASGKVKAEQIRRTGAQVVVAPCHNCIDQLTELNKEYGLGVEVKTVCEIVADALITPARPAATGPGTAPGTPGAAIATP